MPSVELGGPTNFAPVIQNAIELLGTSSHRNLFHVLVILAEGQIVSQSPTREAVLAAAAYPLSIVVVGMGDGPWDFLIDLENSCRNRPYPNFHFLPFHELMAEARELEDRIAPETYLALSVAEPIPEQKRTATALGYTS